MNMNSDDIILQNNTQNTIPKRTVYYRGLNQIRKIRKPRCERAQAYDERSHGIRHDDDASIDAAKVRRISKAAKRAKMSGIKPACAESAQPEWAKGDTENAESGFVSRMHYGFTPDAARPQEDA